MIFITFSQIPFFLCNIFIHCISDYIFINILHVHVQSKSTIVFISEENKPSYLHKKKSKHADDEHKQSTHVIFYY